MSSTPVDPALQDFIAENYPSAELFEEPAGVSLPSIREQVAETEGSQICRNWVRSLRTHRSGLHAGPMRFVYNWPDDETQDECYRVYNERLMRDDVSIETSASFLHKVKSIGSSVKSMSMLSLSTFRRSRSNTQTSSRCRGSTFSGSDPPRSSIDSSNLSTIVYINDTGLKYCLERHRIIDEIITTEISYMSMLRNLSQGIAFTLICPSGAHQAIESLIKLHQNLLDDLLDRKTRPTSFQHQAVLERVRQTGREISSLNPSATQMPSKSATRRRAISQPPPFMATPKETEEIAAILENHFVDFRIYKDYFKAFPFLQAELNVLRQSKDTWDAYERGVEALVRVVQPINQRAKTAKQPYTINDLLIQPVQRICKYPLFLDNLMKCTPREQHPQAYGALLRASEEVKAAIKEVNSFQPDASDVERAQRTMELQVKLEFFSLKEYRNIYKTYGAMKLCGVLHVVHQTGEKVNGSWMLCALFASHILLATTSQEPNKFNVQAIISIRGAKVEEKTNGIGLHCSRTPYTWKLVFSSRAKYFELVLSACSKREEDEWTRLLEEQIEASDAEPIPSGRNQQTQLYFNIEPLQATVINGRLLSIARRTSIHGPLVAVPDLNGLRIYIKGTAAFHVAPLPIAPPINRTQSLQNPRREIVVEAKRQKRIKMEKRLKEVWSHDILPYPGLVPESFVRASTDVLLGTFSNLPAFARRTSNREDKERKNSERFTLAKESSTDEGIKAADETVVPLGMEGYPDEAADKFDTHGDLSRALSNQRRGLLSLRKRSYNLLKLTNGEAESKSPSKVDRPSLRKRLSVALFNRVASPGKPRRFNSVEA